MKKQKNKNLITLKNIIYGLGQELGGSYQKSEGIDITTDREQHNNYQDVVAQDTINDISFLSNNYDLGINLNTVNNHNVNLNQSTQNPSVFNSQTTNNNIEFAGLDKENGDNFAPQIIGGAIGAGVNLYSQYTRNGGNFDTINWTELGVNTIAGVYSAGATSIGGAIIRGGIASGSTETYNQFVNKKDNSLTKKATEIGTASAMGLVTGGLTSSSGSIGNYFNNPILSTPKVIGSPAKGDLINHTLKIPLESVTGIAGGIIPTVVKEIENE